MSDAASEPSGPLSWRDVYTAVGDSEKRLTKVITDSIAPLVASDADHEFRLRSLEKGVEGAPAINAAAIVALTTAVDAIHEREFRQDGGVQAVTIGKSFLLLAFGAMGATVAAVEIFRSLVP